MKIEFEAIDPRMNSRRRKIEGEVSRIVKPNEFLVEAVPFDPEEALTATWCVVWHGWPDDDTFVGTMV